jgi:ParB-like chromosome segregation protein Spo0J
LRSKRVRSSRLEAIANDTPAQSVRPTIELAPVSELKSLKRNARTHSNGQIGQIARSTQTFGFLVPIVVDKDLTVLAGHGRLAAAKQLGLTHVPAIRADGLSEAKRRAFALADNRIAASAGWDQKILAVELPELAELLIEENFDISLTGFGPVEIDQIAIDFEKNSTDPADEISSDHLKDRAISRRGDNWLLGQHKLLCGDARDLNSVKTLIEGDRATMAFLDPHYNLRVKTIVGRGRTKHAEFTMGSGEMSPGHMNAPFYKVKPSVIIYLMLRICIALARVSTDC